MSIWAAKRADIPILSVAWGEAIPVAVNQDHKAADEADERNMLPTLMRRAKGRKLMKAAIALPTSSISYDASSAEYGR
jgi:hypothetical protein